MITQSLTLRGGRQEIRFGSDRLVDVREGPNIRLSFDGGRAFYQSPDLRVDAFVLKPVTPVPGFYPGGGYFGAYATPGQDFWGLYGVTPIRAVPGLNDDFYYLGIDRENVTFNTSTANETRHTLGTRLWGGTGAWDYDTEGAFQFGEFGSRDIRAWTLASNTGYTLQNVWGKPGSDCRQAPQAAAADHGPLMSFDPLFPKFAYFTEAAITAPINFIDAYPSVTIQPTYNFAVMAGVDVLWRYSTLDAFYSTFTGPIDPLVPGSANNKRFLGEQFYLHAEWYPTPQSRHRCCVGALPDGRLPRGGPREKHRLHRRVDCFSSERIRPVDLEHLLFSDKSRINATSLRRCPGLGKALNPSGPCRQARLPIWPGPARSSVSVEQCHARIAPNNATRLSGKEWLCAATRA